MKPLKPYTVVFIDGYDGPFWQWFNCYAEDGEHAEEQFLNAYPGNDIEIVWVNEGQEYFEQE